MNFHFILIELCNIMGICVWTGSLQCFMTQCTIETVCLTPRVTMQGYESQKCEISINHNLTSPTKQWIARQIIGNLTRTKHEVLQQPTGMIMLTVSVFAPLPDHCDPHDPGMASGQVTPALWPQLIIPLTHPWPLSTRGSETHSSSCVESSHPSLVRQWMGF